MAALYVNDGCIIMMKSCKFSFSIWLYSKLVRVLSQLATPENCDTGIRPDKVLPGRGTFSWGLDVWQKSGWVATLFTNVQLLFYHVNAEVIFFS